MPRAELIHFDATDGVRLSGLLYEPRRRTGHAAVFVHGNGDSSVFTSTRTNRFARELIRKGIAYFPFDNRGARLVQWLKRRRGKEVEAYAGGMAHEKIADAVFDIEGALRLVRSRGYRRLSLIGHSTGANKIALYHHRKPRNHTWRSILLAPGDDTGLYYHALGRRRFYQALERCRREVGRGRGDRFVPASLSPFLISWNALLDTIDPDGDYNVFPFLESLRGLGLSGRKPLFREYEAIRKPTLVVIGANDEYCFGEVPACMNLLRAHAARPRRFRFEIIPETDHGFHGAQTEVGELIAEWILG